MDRNIERLESVKTQQDICFHDSGLVEVCDLKDGRVKLSFEDVRVDGQLRKASVYVTGVGQILRDDVRVNGFTMEFDDGEVLTLEIEPESILLIVEWSDWKNRSQTTVSYRISCQSITVEVI